MKDKKTTILEVLFGLVFLILFVASGILANENTKLKKEVDSLKSSNMNVSKTPFPSSMPSIIPSASPSSTSQWKTYTNPTYHISFQYPSDLITPNIGDSGKMLTSIFSSVDKSKQLMVWTADTKSDLLDQHGFTCVKPLLTNMAVTVGGHGAVMNENETDTSRSDCSSNTTIIDTYFVSVSDIPLDIQYSGPKSQVSQVELNQILSSFQFTQ